MEAGDRGRRRDMIEPVHGRVIQFAMWVLAAGCMTTSTRNTGDVAEIDMKFVAGGTFRVGSDLNELDAIQAATHLPSKDMLLAEVPSRNVTVADFYMDTYDVTNDDFAKFVAAMPAWSREKADPTMHNGRYLEHWKSAKPPEDFRKHPVTFITCIHFTIGTPLL